ncbi:MAG: type II toxin-antitoxin system death-on-curing family toxin [Thermodesulfobacteriota bacterium]
MIRYLSLGEVLELHRRIIQQTGGAVGVRDLAALESAVAQPRMTFSGHDLYPSLEAKAAAICFFIVQNHPFLDGNKRCGHAAMETFLVLNGKEIDAAIDEIERIILQVASGNLPLEELIDWVKDHSFSITL